MVHEYAYKLMHTLVNWLIIYCNDNSRKDSVIIWYHWI